MLQALYNALKPGGKLLLIEYRAEDPDIPIKPLHKMSVAQVNKELQAAGFTLYKLETMLPIQHFLLYEKAKRQAFALLFCAVITQLFLISLV